MSKAADAFRTISEIADELRVPKHVLRFWELKFPQLKPMKRGGGRRYYRPEDLELLRGIQHLLHADGYTIKGVQKILREQGVEAAKAVGERKLEIARTKPTGTAKKNAKSEKANLSLPASRRLKTKGARPTNSQASTETVKFLERAINELEACRAILRAETGSKKPARKPISKQRRVAASR